MKIWFSRLPEGVMNVPKVAGRVGLFVTDGDPPNADVPFLVRWRDEEPVAVDRASSILIPVGANADAAVVKRAATTGKLIYLTLNGLGTTALATSLKEVGDAPVVLVYDAAHVGDVAYIEQLAWLAGQERPFAIRTADFDRLRVAATAAPEALILPENSTADPRLLWAIANLRSEGVMRPMSGEEVDAVIGREKVLTVTRPMTPGETIEAEHLTVEETTSGGLSPHLRSAVAGRTLRYPIKSGEPLTFGHLL